MATNKFEICTRALLRIGANPITSFEDGTTESKISAGEYDPLVNTELSNYRWRFASKQAAVNKLSAVPLDEYDAYFQLPADLLVLHAVKVGGKPIEYDRYEGKVAANADDGVVIDHTFRPTEAAWPAYFENLIVERLQAIFMAAIRRELEASQAKHTYIDQIILPRARSIDAQQQTARRVPQGRLVKARRVGG